MNYSVTVIIPTYKDWGRLEQCLDAIKAQSYSSELIEVIIVNNDPDDNKSLEVIPDNFKMIHEFKPGSYSARNAAIKIAKGEVLAFTDSDCIPDRDWLVQGIKGISEGYKRVAGGIELFYKQDKLSLAEIYEKAFSFNQYAYAQKGKAATANMFAVAEVFSKVGLFDDDLKSGGDMEWGIRATKENISIKFSKLASVKHPSRHKMSELIDKKKRVAGGVAKSEELLSKHSYVKNFLPPLTDFKSLLKREDLSYKEKIIAFSISYYLRVIGNITVFSVRYLGKSELR